MPIAHVFKRSPKGLQFFHLVSPLELPKVMGLLEIHHPKALCHHAGQLYCPCCARKKERTRGTVDQSFADSILPIRTGLQWVSPASLPLFLKPCSIMAKAAGSQRKVTLKRKMGGLMMHPHQTDLLSAIPPGQNTICHGGGNVSALSHLL